MGVRVYFMVGGEVFALDVARLVEVANRGAVRKVPDMPPYIVGVVELRGAAVPIYDLRLRFGVAPAAGEGGGRERVLVLRLGGRERAGLVVDAVLAVERCEAGEIRPAPAVFRGLKAKYIEGIGTRAGASVIHLDPDALITSEERIALRRAREAGRAERT
jgi:purine-binding chemotaxis protein CheW